MCAERDEREREGPQHGNGASSEETSAVMFRADGFGWGTSESMHAKSTDDAGGWLRAGREVGLGCGAFDGTSRQSG